MKKPLNGDKKGVCRSLGVGYKPRKGLGSEQQDNASSISWCKSSMWGVSEIPAIA